MKMRTLQEIALEFAKKQPGMADNLTEDAPILEKVKWIAASHGLWNVAETLEEIKGAGFTKPDAPLPNMYANSELKHIDLQLMAGYMEVGYDLAMKMGGPIKYFAKFQDKILRKAGMDTEVQLIMNNWLAAAKKNKNLIDAGADGPGWFILAVRFDDLNNVGLYDPNQFDSGRLLKIEYPYNGSQHFLRNQPQVLGYSVTYRGNFGYQILDDGRKTCAAIVNIDEEHAPTPTQIDDLLAIIRAKPGTTYLFTSPRGQNYSFNKYKSEQVRLVTNQKDIDTAVETWGGIAIVASHNIYEKIPKIVVK